MRRRSRAEIDFARETPELLGSQDSHSFEALLAEYDSLLKRYVRRVPGEKQRLEIRRRIAEGKLSAACSKGRSVAEIFRLMHRWLSLGTSDRYQKTVVLLAIGWFCVDRSDFKAVNRVLSKFDPGIEKYQRELGRELVSAWQRLNTIAHERT